ncbi:hypothetical protein [uncultured Bacteroides sp.]|uniref:hypothetical protein n=1 Tax=uncultured Bacteroides sp. TaxID=162156 RepID=UPI0026244845|nr:hypothetical protein [uncultured Bacteroides sp.]
MDLKHLHIISMGLLLCGLLGFASCDHESLGPSEEEDNSVFLTFHTDVAGGSTRAEDEKPADEKINQLLIVIVSEEPAATEEGTKWVVEYNRLIESASTGVSLIDGHNFKVKAGCKKRIYLIANGKGLKDANENPLDFTNEAFDATGSEGKAKADNYVFALPSNLDNGIPMTAMYEVSIPSKKDLQNDLQYDSQNDSYKLLETLYVVRAATKFSFTFTNAITSMRKDIAIKKIAIDRIANKAYLMPHVNKNNDNKYWVADTDRKNAVALDKSWIDWMVDEAENTKEGNNIDKYQWLTDYEVPEGVQHAIAEHEIKEELTITPSKSAGTEFYLPESQNLISGDNPLKLQEYKLSVTTLDEGSIHENVHTAILPQLASLFRNTHVKVNVTFKDHGLSVEVKLVPYAEVELEPDFGLDNPWQHLIPIYDQERVNIICYYDEETGKYYNYDEDSDQYIETINPFWAIDAGTGWIIIRNEKGEILYYYDAETGQYYNADKEKIEDPYNKPVA